MIRKEKQGLVSYHFDSFDEKCVDHAVYTRLGGISEGPYRWLNLGGTNGDKPEHVYQNHIKLFSNFGRPFESRYDVWQVHGDTIRFTEEPRPETQKHQPADGIFTQNPDVTLIMRFADCVPLFFHDPVEKVVGIVHAGWQGTLLKIADVAVKAISKHYGSKAENLKVGIAPSICGKCYQIGEDVRQKFINSWGEDAASIIHENEAGYTLDLWQANERVLRNAGVINIEQSNICTAENLHEWYSYRKEKGFTGRFAAMIALVK